MLWILLFTITAASIAAWTDWRTGKIPNWLTLPLLPAGPLMHLILGWSEGDVSVGLEECGASAAGILLSGLAPWLLYRRGAMGGGDVKLFAALGGLCQPLLGLEIEAYSLVIAAVVVPLRLVAEGRLLGVLWRGLRRPLKSVRSADEGVTASHDSEPWFRLGPAVLCGVTVALALHPETILFLLP